MLSKLTLSLVFTLIVVLISRFAGISTVDAAAGVALVTSFYAAISVYVLKVRQDIFSWAFKLDEPTLLKLYSASISNIGDENGEK
jgi:hypothetical protein